MKSISRTGMAVMIGIVIYLLLGQVPPEVTRPTDSPNSTVSRIGQAYAERQSDIQVQDEGVVVRVLADDTQGSRHQRFILELASGQRLLIAHNIDLAPRIPGLKSGDRVAFYGEYEWNKKGGVVHWTHHDPGGRHIDGWLRRDKRTYQ